MLEWDMVSNLGADRSEFSELVAGYSFGAGCMKNKNGQASLPPGRFSFG
jgi:hypothetical protein